MTKRINAIISVLLFLAVLIVIVNSFRASNEPYAKYTARVGTYVVSLEADALVVRDERVLMEGAGGVMEPSVSEGERVAANTRVGALITGDIDQEKVSELNRINHEIDSVTRTLSESGVLTIADDKVDSALNLSLNNLRYASSKNDVAESLMQAENVRILTRRKQGVTSSVSEQTKLSELIERRNEISSSLGGLHKDVYAPVSGMYSDNMDGLETVLTSEKIKSLTPSDISDAGEKLKSNTGSGACKIINNYKWYLVFNLTSEEALGLRVGKEYEVNFKDLNEVRLNGSVVYVSEADKNDLCAVAMQFDKYINDFTSIRKTEIEICKEKYSGIYIPRSAVAVEGVQGVWVQNEVRLEFRSFEEVYRADDFLLVKENAQGQGGHQNIALYDHIVLNP